MNEPTDKEMKEGKVTWTKKGAEKEAPVVETAPVKEEPVVREQKDSKDGDKPILQLPMYQRNEFLTPHKSEAVDGWLRAFFGSHYERAEKWIQYALAFEEGPICALSIKAPAGIGKKMLTEGLAECLVHPYLATGHDMCGKENGALLKTPFLVVNEGLPSIRDNAPADVFKELTAGDPIRVRELNRLYRSSIPCGLFSQPMTMKFFTS